MKVFTVLCLVALTVSASPMPAQASDADVRSLLKQKCFQCHGEALQMSNLDLRTRESILKGGDKGPAVIAGDAGASLLYRRVAGIDKPLMPMAPMPPLTPKELAVIKDWIEKGAHWEGSESSTAKAPAAYGNQYQEKPLTDEDRNWWAFRKPVRHPVPTVTDARWKTSPIDAFLKAALEREGMEPAPQADRHTLARRLYLDLTGLLPSPQEVEAFVKDSSPDAYEKLVDRLLASPHYGERWGRNWLDVVRYADSSGYEHDYDIENAWRYRDYIIKAFNEDKPFDRFIREQLAGDELDGDNYENVIATTFFRIGPRVRFREKDNPYYRYEYLDDMIRTTFQGFMGLSVHCARCHDHKFDPISRLEYYRSMAMVFGNVDHDYPLAAPEKVAENERIRRGIEEEMRPLQLQVARIEAPYRKAEFEKRLNTFPREIQDAVRTPEDRRTPGQQLVAAQILSLDVDPDAAANQVGVGERKLIKVSAADHEAREKLLARIRELRKKLPEPLPVAEGIRDGDYRLTPDGRGDDPLPGKGNRFDYGVECCYLPQPGQRYEVPPVYFGANGLDVAADQKSFVVEPGFLRVAVHGDPPPVALPPGNGHPSSGRRLALAHFIASPENPLTARVMVNRIWQWHFGRGIVSTPGNFGKMGTPPSHPELLDWLATEFVRQGWSIKKMHRLILNSEAYKMTSSFYRAANAEKDPNNVFLWRFPLQRLEAEAIRDAILSASGQIDLEAGGEPFFPSIPKSVRESYRPGKWVLTKEQPSTWRRSVYSYWKRGLKYPMFEVFDQPDPNVTCEKRNVTTVPTQALTLLNNEFVLMQSRHFAERVAKEAGGEPAAKIERFYRIALSRAPSARELESQLQFLRKQSEFHKARISDPAAVDLAALTDLAHVMLNSNEFVYIN